MGGWSTSDAETAQQFCEKARHYKRLGRTRSDMSNTISLMNRIVARRETSNIVVMGVPSLEAVLAKMSPQRGRRPTPVKKRIILRFSAYGVL